MDVVELEPALPEPLRHPRHALALGAERLLSTFPSLSLTHSLLDAGVAGGVEIDDAEQAALGVEYLITAVEELVEGRDLVVSLSLAYNLP